MNSLLIDRARELARESPMPFRSMFGMPAVT